MPSVKAGNINLNYDTYGDGEPLLLIMGFGMSGAGWIPSLPFFNGFKSIYFDNRGTGLSDKPEGIYTVEAMADDASNLLRALGIAKAKVFGVSMGGMIAQELTLRHPEQVTKVVLGCTPRWLKTEQKFKCPCHGSGYYISGLNFEGPAPRPMDRFKIYVGDDGQLVVDKSVIYEMEPGVDPNEQHPESILKLA